MRLATLRTSDRETLHVLHEGYLWAAQDINSVFGMGFPLDLLTLLEEDGELDRLRAWYLEEGDRRFGQMADCAIPVNEAEFAPFYRHPRKIWGIGLNYHDHAADLAESAPTTEPASFMKPDTTIIGHGDTIQLPLLSERVTGEAELGLIIGRPCRHVPREDWRSVVAGFTAILDMTAEDILRRNPRNLTQSKSFDTFFSFGPVFVSADEIDDVNALTVSTVHNGAVHASNQVSNMTFPPDILVSYHSQIMTLLPGDIISTGTPGAATLAEGDTLECRIDGFEPLRNTVKDLKLST